MKEIDISNWVNPMEAEVRQVLPDKDVKQLGRILKKPGLRLYKYNVISKTLIFCDTKPKDKLDLTEIKSEKELKTTPVSTEQSQIGKSDIVFQALNDRSAIAKLVRQNPYYVPNFLHGRKIIESSLRRAIMEQKAFIRLPNGIVPFPDTKLIRYEAEPRD